MKRKPDAMLTPRSDSIAVFPTRRTTSTCVHLSAAVIGQNPPLFRFSFDPLAADRRPPVREYRKAREATIIGLFRGLFRAKPGMRALGSC